MSNTIAKNTIENKKYYCKKNMRNGCGENCIMDCSEDFAFDVRKKIFEVYQIKQKSDHTLCLG